MRILAAVLAFVLCTAEGLRRRFSLKNRVQLLSELVLMLNSFSIEINCRALTADELIETASGRFAELVRSKRAEFSDIKSAWEAACRELPKNRERELLTAFGQSLGTTDKAGQLRLLELYGTELSALKADAESSYLKKGEAFSRVGMLCGAAAAVLIL